jgi:2'-5' RNA ligase
MNLDVNKEHSYSLWLRPDQTQIDALMAIISELSHRYNSTPFPPHITLLSSISADISTISDICKKIITQHTVFEISLKHIEHTERYYRNLYILAKLEQPLLTLFEEVQHQLNNKMHDLFIPHVSLFYGKLDKRKQLALKEQLDEYLPKVFTCKRLDLYCTSGKESEWFLIDSFNLKITHSL